jgi:hypothetical protein
MDGFLERLYISHFIPGKPRGCRSMNSGVIHNILPVVFAISIRVLIVRVKRTGSFLRELISKISVNFVWRKM